MTSCDVSVMITFTLFKMIGGASLSDVDATYLWISNTRIWRRSAWMAAGARDAAAAAAASWAASCGTCRCASSASSASSTRARIWRTGTPLVWTRACRPRASSGSLSSTALCRKPSTGTLFSVLRTTKQCILTTIHGDQTRTIANRSFFRTIVIIIKVLH